MRRPRAGGHAGFMKPILTKHDQAAVKADAAPGDLPDATHYMRWLVQQKDAKTGLQGAKAIVYRESRKAREAP